jgi:hypothetical protein
MTVPKNVVHQCKSCPWRVDCGPDRDIPGYNRELHKKLTNTIASGLDFCSDRLHCMSCHYSNSGADFPCAGWLHNQLGVGNNLGVRMAVLRGSLPVPEVEGDHHGRFEDTLIHRRRSAGGSTVRRTRKKRTMKCKVLP